MPLDSFHEVMTLQPLIVIPAWPWEDETTEPETSFEIMTWLRVFQYADHESVVRISRSLKEKFFLYFVPELVVSTLLYQKTNQKFYQRLLKRIFLLYRSGKNPAILICVNVNWNIKPKFYESLTSMINFFMQAIKIRVYHNFYQFTRNLIDVPVSVYYV